MRLAEVPVYVVHGRPFLERRQRLERELARYGLSATWITSPDPPDLTRSLRRQYYRRSRLLWWRRARTTPGSPEFRELSPQEISVAIKHVLAYEAIGAGASDWGLILEDDAVFEDDFAMRFDDYFVDVPSDAELVFIGSCCGLRIPDVVPGRHFYRKEDPAAKCADSYLVRRDAAQRLRREMVPFTLAVDWELNYHFARSGYRVYWLEPPLVAQGSETGLFETTLREPAVSVGPSPARSQARRRAR